MENEPEYVIKELSYDNVGDDVAGGDDDNRGSYEAVVAKKGKIIRDGFGTLPLVDPETGEDIPGSVGPTIYRYTLLNANNISVQVITYGATITSISVPDKRGRVDDIVLGYEDITGYRNPKNPYFGATIGRITGVIKNADFTIDKETFVVTSNFLGQHHANGGLKGFDKVLWHPYIKGEKLFLSYMSADKEEGFPGDVVVNRSFELTSKNELIIETSATSTRSTPIDISTHVDWNLASNSAGSVEMYKHYLMLNADRYAQVDSNSNYMMTGRLKKVSGTVFDLRIPRLLGKLIHRVPGGGYDHFLSLTHSNCKSVAFAARLMHPDSGRYLEVMTDQPGITVYSGNKLYAKECYVEGHPESCWSINPIKEELDEEEEKPLPVVSNPDEGKGEGGGLGGGGEDGSDKPDSNPSSITSNEPKVVKGKMGTIYVRHGGIRIVPQNHPDAILKKRNYAKHILRPGKTYKSTTIFRFGVTIEKKPDLSEISPDII